LCLVYRQHVLDIILENAFTTCYVIPSTKPKTFKTFQQKWKTINTSQFQTIEENRIDKDETILFCKKQLTLINSRDN